MTKGSWRPGWEWGVGSLVVASLIVCSRIGQHMPLIVQDVAFIVLIFAAPASAGMAWTAFELMRRDGSLRQWRMGVSFFGCVALSAAFVVPIVCMLTPLEWFHVGGYLCIGSSLVAVIAGIFAPGLVRFSLIFGGLVVASLVVIIPMAVL